MARHQYRIAGELGWQSNSGNAVLAISNPQGSGKKLVLRRFEINQLSSTTTPAAGSVASATPNYFTLARATVAGGIAIAPSKNDSAAATWPASVSVLRRAAIASPVPVRRISVLKQLNQANLSWMARQSNLKGFATAYSRPRKDTAVEGIVIRAGEGVALYTEVLQNSLPVRVSATVLRSGSPARSYSFRYYTSAIATGEAIFAISNAVGSGETVTLRDVSIEEVGTYDSPYFQIVPIGAVIEGENSEAVTILKMDSASPASNASMQVRMDVPILPFGMPENALADSSTGSPKGFNYLKTKDFLGPVYRTLFPESVAHRFGFMPDVLGAGQDMTEQFVRKSEITIREGEGLALVSGAEAAAGASSAIGVSGWSSFEFAATVDVLPKIEPVLTLTGLRNPTEVRIFAAGTQTLLAGSENVTTGAFSWTFDPSENAAVDISILSLSYQNLRILAQPLTLADITIPVQQAIDRNYANT